MIFNRIIHLIVVYWVSFSLLQDSLIPNEKVRKIFLHLKVTQPLLCFWIKLVFVSSTAEFSYHALSNSLMPSPWKHYSQVSPWKILENFTFSPVSQAVFIGVLRQGVLSMISSCFFSEFTTSMLGSKVQLPPPTINVSWEA